MFSNFNNSRSKIRFTQSECAVFDIITAHILYKSMISVNLLNKAKMPLYCSPEPQTSFESTVLLVQELKIHFHDDSCRTILAPFVLQITPIPPNKLPVSLPFGSGEQA